MDCKNRAVLREREGEEETETDQLTPLKNCPRILSQVIMPVSPFTVDVLNSAMVCRDLYHFL